MAAHVEPDSFFDRLVPHAWIALGRYLSGQYSQVMTDVWTGQKK
jgi:hypothetical protein